MRFTNMTLQNFRAWEALDIPIRPITLLFGPNNSGKSTILSVFALLAQTIESADRDVPLLLEGGGSVDLGTFGEIVFRNDRRRSIGISLSLDAKGMDDIRLRTAKDFSPLTLETTFRYRPRRRQIIMTKSEIFDTLNGSRRSIFRTRYNVSKEQHVIEHIIAEVGSTERIRVNSSSNAIHFFVSPYGIQPGNLTNLFEAIRHVGTVQIAFSSALRSVGYLSSFREKPGRTYNFGGQNPSSVGAYGELTTDVLVSDFYQKGNVNTKILSRISHWMNRAKLASSLKLNRLTERHFEIRATHPITGESQNLADVGSGLSQVLPVLTAGYGASRRSSVIIEEPEIHLHPKAQSEVGQFIYEMYLDGIQMIVETHSEHLLLRIQRLVAEGRIPPGDIAVYYVYPKGESKEISLIDIGEDGTFVDQWPEGFFPERLEEARGILKGQARRQQGE